MANQTYIVGIDENGKDASVKVNKNGTIFEISYLEISKGNIPGHSLIHKFAKNEDISTTVEDIWTRGGIKVWEESAETLVITSTNAGDNAGGNGIQEVTIEGLDTNFNPIIEIIELHPTDGTLSVITTKSFIRVYRAFGSRVGIYTGGNLGNITINGVISGNPKGEFILEHGKGYSQTHVSHYTVRTGYTAYILQFKATCTSSKVANVHLLKRECADIITGGEMCPVRQLYEITGLLGGELAGEQFPAPIKLTEKTDIWCNGNLDVGNGELEVSYTLLLVENNI